MSTDLDYEREEEEVLRQSDVEAQLRAIASGSKPPTDLSVTYDDMHGLWGGMTMLLSGSGIYERRRLGRGGNAEQSLTTRVSNNEIRELAYLMIELKAWEQECPERAPVPDEVRAKLTIGIGDGCLVIWEWYADLIKNKRLVRIRDRMLDFDTSPGG